MRIYQKLLLGVGFSLTLTAGVGYYAIDTSQRSLQQAIEHTATSQARMVMDEVQRHIDIRISDLRASVTDYDIREVLDESNRTFDQMQDTQAIIDQRDADWIATPSGETNPLMEQLMTNLAASEMRTKNSAFKDQHGRSLFDEIFITNRYGVNVAQTNRTSDYRQDDETWWQQAKNNGIYVGDLDYDKSVGAFSTDLCIRINDENGHFIGVAKGVLNIDEINNLLDSHSRNLKVNGQHQLILFTGKKKIVHRVDKPAATMQDGSTYFEEYLDTSPKAISVFTSQRVDQETGQPVLSAYACSTGHDQFAQLGWVLLLEYNAEDVLKPVIVLRRRLMYAIAAVMVLMTTAGVLLVRSLSYRINQLSQAVGEISQGNLDNRVSTDGNDELSELASRFNTMTDRLKQADVNQGKAIEELAAARDAADAANHSKSEFLANMSHEIRTPMTAILGYTDLLTDQANSTANHRDSIDAIRRNGEHLLTIINDILDLSKIQAGKMTVEQIDCSPHQLLTDVVSLTKIRADSKGLKMGVEYLGPIPLTIRTDPVRLRQILINLVGNAIKFTQEGGIRITVKLDGDPASADPYLRLEVIDTGIGMTPQQIDKLFRPFTQAETATTRQFGGTGLGLTISKRFAEMLGGDITIQSKDGEGSSFIVTIATGPLDAVELIEKDHETIIRESKQTDATNKAVPTKPLNQSRILLAEDGPDNQKLIAFILKKWGALVTVVENGRLAKDKALAAKEEHTPFDVILMDMQMPEMDGYTATRKLREQGYKGPIIALTANAMPEDRQKCLDAGCDNFATKPINKDKLLATIQRHYAHQSHTVLTA